MIRVPSELKLPQISELTEEISRLEKSTDLYMPTNLSFGGPLGMSLTLAQLTAKWARSKHAGSLKAYSSGSSEQTYESLAGHPHGILSMFMSMRHSIGNQSHDRDEVLRHAASRVEAMNGFRFQDTLKGQGVLLACFSGTRNEFIKPFYGRASIEDGLRGSSDFRALTEELLATADRSFAKNMPLELKDTLSQVLFELIENTNDHGTISPSIEKFSYRNPNARGLLIKKFTEQKGITSLTLNSERRITTWMTKAYLNESRRSQNAIEISVFDFGPGIAGAKLIAEGQKPDLTQISLKEEEEIVKSAFELGSTTKTKSGTGIGLDTTFKCLSQLNAALKLRTGRIDYWHDFTSQKHQFSPEHFSIRTPQLAPVPGTVFTILVPLLQKLEGSTTR